MNPMLTLDSSSLPPHHPPPHTSTPNLHAKPATARHAEFISASQHRTTHSPPRRIRHAELVSASQPNTLPQKRSWIKSRMTAATKTTLHFPTTRIDHHTDYHPAIHLPDGIRTRPFPLHSHLTDSLPNHCRSIPKHAAATTRTSPCRHVPLHPAESTDSRKDAQWRPLSPETPC